MRWIFIAIALFFAWPASAAEGTFDSNGVKIRYIDEGQGVPVLLLHGQNSSTEASWTSAGVVANLAHRRIVGGSDRLSARARAAFASPDNEPYLSAALDMVSKLVERVEPRVPAQRLMLLGFSQGACLTLEWAARHARRYGAVVGLSGGLIGPDGTPRDYPGGFDETPVFLGCSDVDPHIPKERVVETGDIFKRMGAVVTARLYPGMAHMVSGEEIAVVRELVELI